MSLDYHRECRTHGWGLKGHGKDLQIQWGLRKEAILVSFFVDQSLMSY